MGGFLNQVVRVFWLFFFSFITVFYLSGAKNVKKYTYKYTNLQALMFTFQYYDEYLVRRLCLPYGLFESAILIRNYFTRAP